jgi:hypothetical protein
MATILRGTGCPEYRKLRDQYFEAARVFQQCILEPTPEDELSAKAALRKVSLEAATEHWSRCQLCSTFRE